MDQAMIIIFFIKELTEEFKKQFNSLGENNEKYITFTDPIEKIVTRIDRNGEESTKNICYILRFIDNTRFIGSSSSNLFNNHSEGIHSIKCKFRHDDKNCKTCGIKYKHCHCFLQYENFKDDLIEYKCLCCNKNYQYKLDEKLKEQFFNTHRFCNHDNNKFILLLRKDVYPYKYMDDWGKFNQKSLPKKDFYTHVSMKDIANAEYARFCKDFEIKKLGEYHDLHVHSDAVLLYDVFENFRNMCIKDYEVDPFSQL